MIERWTRVYAPEQLLIISQEEAFANPSQVYEQVLRHIGAPATKDSHQTGLENERKSRPGNSDARRRRALSRENVCKRAQAP